MYTVALRRIDPARNMARFYAVEVMPTLFGHWAVVRRWGRVNTDGRRSETWFDDLAAARHLSWGAHRGQVQARLCACLSKSAFTVASLTGAP